MFFICSYRYEHYMSISHWALIVAYGTLEAIYYYQIGIVTRSYIIVNKLFVLKTLETIQELFVLDRNT